MIKPSDYFKKLDLAYLDANTAQFIREKILTLPNIDVLEGTKEFETIKAIVEESFPRAIGIEPVVVAPIVEEIPEPIIEAVVEPIIDTKQEEIKTISGEIAEMTDLVDLLNEVVAENPQDLDSMDVLELYKETLVELSNKLKSLTEVITEAVSEVKDNIEEVKEVIKTDVVDTKGILTAPKKYKTEDGEEVLGYESDWNFGTKKHLGETVVYYSYKEGISGKYSVLTGILHKGEIIYSEDKISNKEFENKFDSEKEALDFSYEISLDKESVDKYENGGALKTENYSTIAYKTKKSADKSASQIKEYFGDRFIKSEVLKGKDERGDYGYQVHYELKKDKYEKGGSLGQYVAVHESKDGYWTIASKPTTKENAEAMLGGTPKNEVGKVVTLEEAKAHKKTVGEEYLYEKGGSIKNYDLVVRTPKGLVTKKDFDGFSKDEIIKWGKDRDWTYNEKGEKIGGQSLNDYEFFVREFKVKKSNLPSKKYESGGMIKNIDSIKKSIGETVFNHINSLNKEQLEKQLKELKSEMQRDYFESNGKTERYKKLNDEKVYILHLLERANVDYAYPVGRKVYIADYPKNESNNYTVVGHENYNEKYGWETIIENENEKVTMYENRLEPSIEKLAISYDNPLSSQLIKMTGDTWNTIDFESTEKGHHLSTKTPFRHIKTGRIFQVIN